MYVRICVYAREGIEYDYTHAPVLKYTIYIYIYRTNMYVYNINRCTPWGFSYTRWRRRR